MSLPLWTPLPIPVIEERDARITYWPSFVARDDADRWLRALLDGVPWDADHRRMYDREVAVPRLLAHYRLDESGVPIDVHEVAQRVIRHTGVHFTSVGLNCYRDGRDSVAPHHDRLGELESGSPVAIVSLGGPRSMVISTQRQPRATRKVGLEHGSLLVMDYGSQQHYLHGIPKTTRPVAPRISLAFRVRSSSAPSA